MVARSCRTEQHHPMFHRRQISLFGQQITSTFLLQIQPTGTPPTCLHSMKTKLLMFQILSWTILLCLIDCQARGQPNYIATNTVKFPWVSPGGDLNLASGYRTTNLFLNFYPCTRFAGEKVQDELNYYLTNVVSGHNYIPGFFAAEADTNGYWGLPADGFQLSLRFHQFRFAQSEFVPAYIILRNLSSATRIWTRNAVPDNGYQFTLRNGTNTLTWFRPQPEWVPMMTGSGSLNECDPYRYIAYPHTQGLT